MDTSQTCIHSMLVTEIILNNNLENIQVSATLHKKTFLIDIWINSKKKKKSAPKLIMFSKQNNNALKC